MPQKPSQKSVDLNRPQPTSPGPLHLPAKIKDLGLLTHTARKSVSRRFLWCNSQLLTPSGRRAMKETMFIPSRATRGENRLRYPHGMLKIISNQKWTTLARSRPVARSIVWLISRRPEGVRSRELHHENRREALLPAIWVRRLKS